MCSKNCVQQSQVIAPGPRSARIQSMFRGSKDLAMRDYLQRNDDTLL
jgi:hypothetical protein